MNTQLKPEGEQNWLSMLVRGFNLGGMILVLSFVFIKLYLLADSKATELANIDDLNPEAISGIILIAGGLLPIVTIVGYFALVLTLVTRYKIKL